MAKSTDTVKSFQAIQGSIRRKEFSAVYVLQGEETYFTDELTKLIEDSVVPETARSFNQTILYGKETNVQDIVSMARRFPMMSDYQLIIVKDAEDLKELDGLAAYMQNPLPTTVLVLSFRKGKLDLRSKTGKAASKFTSATFSKLRDYQIRDWLPNYTKEKGKVLDQEAVNRLLDLLGADLPSILNEINKLLGSVDGDFIRVNHVDEQVGFNREYNVFELQSALARRNFNKSIQIAHQMAKNSEKGDMLRTSAVLNSYFSKIMSMKALKSFSKHDVASFLGVNPYFVDEYLTAQRNFPMIELEWVMNQLKYFDMRLKGINKGDASDGDLLVETVVSILNGRGK